ncbi:MAG: hypothetical protein AB7I50_03740 [Vicinamibacterales bacterium]
MTPSLAPLLAEYQQDLEAQIELLERLLAAAHGQFAAALPGSAFDLAKACEERARVMTALLDVERRQLDRRAILHRHLDLARRLDGFSTVAALHRRATRSLSEIEEVDLRTRERLAREQALRTATVHTLDAGETTLAAYRKVLTSGHEISSLVDQHG